MLPSEQPGSDAPASARALAGALRALAGLVTLGVVVADFAFFWSVYGGSSLVMFVPPAWLLLPLWALTWGVWWPVVAVFGGGALAWLLYNAADRLAGRAA